ncbi:MAG TPA: glycosyltransferase family 2 protein [Anaerolineales bacterium]|nr:glycosyltransferase family 2 protein [Anaerolineales bacterium]
MLRISRPLVSVVCLSHNRQKNVLELLATLQEQDYDPLEIILVDNHSQDGTPDAVENNFPEVKRILCPQNFGMVSYNFGFANARGEYILVIDDDGVPAATSCIAEVVNRLEANPHLAGVACTIRMRDTGLVAYDSPQFIPQGNNEIGFPAAAFNGTGAGLRAEALRQVGYYPFYYYRSWLEFHLSTRFHNAGWDVRYFPTIEVWHTRSSGSADRPFSYYGLRNYLWYVWEFYPWPEVLLETLHYLGSRGKSTLAGRLSMALFMKAFIDGLGGWRNIHSHRKPISRDVLVHLRQVRRYGNDYGLVQKHRSFPFPTSNASLDETFRLQQTGD